MISKKPKAMNPAAVTPRNQRPSPPGCAARVPNDDAVVPTSDGSLNQPATTIAHPSSAKTTARAATAKRLRPTAHSPASRRISSTLRLRANRQVIAAYSYCTAKPMRPRPASTTSQSPSGPSKLARSSRTNASTSKHRPDDLDEDCRVDRLRHVAIESCRERPLTIAVASVGGYRGCWQVRPTLRLATADLPNQGESVRGWHADIGEEHIGPAAVQTS